MKTIYFLKKKFPVRINVDQSAIELVHVRSKLNENREHETIVSVVYRKWHTRRGVKKYRSTGKKM